MSSRQQTWHTRSTSVTALTCLNAHSQQRKAHQCGKHSFGGDLALPTSQYKARTLIFMFLKSCGVQIFRDQLDSEDPVAFFDLVKDKKFVAQVDMSPDRNDPTKRWPEIGFTGFIYEQNHILFKEGASEPKPSEEIESPW